MPDSQSRPRRGALIAAAVLATLAVLPVVCWLALREVPPPPMKKAAPPPKPVPPARSTVVFPERARCASKFEAFFPPKKLGIGAIANPYDPDEIAVDARVTLPGGREITTPCFWRQEGKLYYERRPSEDRSRSVEWERFRPTGPAGWCLRYNPREPGVHRVEILVTKKDARRVAWTGKFTAGKAARKPRGPVEADPGGRWFRFRNGEFFFPVGENLGWPEESGSRIYGEWLKKLGAAGGNCGRLWLIHYMAGTTLEWTSKPENRSYEGPGRYNQGAAARVDRILELAEKNGVYLMLCFLSFGDHNWAWEQNPYHAKNGGWLADPKEFFTDARAHAAFKKRLRYAVARYGWSDHVWAWELWNEVETSKGYEEKAVADWHRQMGDYLRETDVHGHMITTSYRFTPQWTPNNAYAMKSFDFAQAHSYLPDVIDVLPRRIKELARFKKPRIIGEFGIGVRPDYFGADPAGLHVHDGLWAVPFAGGAGTGLTWWWERYVHPRDLYFHFTGISRFMKGEDLRGYQPVECTVSVNRGVPSPAVRALAGKGRALLWAAAGRSIVTATDSRGAAVTRRYARSATVTSARVSLKLPAPKKGQRLRVVFYDTIEGVPISAAWAKVNKGWVEIEFPEIRDDLAAKVFPVPAGGAAAPVAPPASMPLRARFEKLLEAPQKRAYLPLVEPYASIKDLDAGTAEGRFAARLDRLIRAAKPGKKRRALATLRVRLDYLTSTTWAAYKLKDLGAALAALLAGRDPFASERGNSLRGYYAANDDSCQPYSLTLPPKYNPKRKYPLVLHLHHHGWGDWYRPFQGHAAPELDGAIVVAPHGRGSCDYLWIAEDDSLAVIDATVADYPVDDARVYVIGWSMGGTGSFHLPGRYPDRFAASCPKAGNADFTAWEKAWGPDRVRLKTPLDAARMFLRWKTAPVTYAENFLHVPIAMDHGSGDSINPVGHSKSMAGRLKQLGYKNVRYRFGSGGHGWGASLGEQFNWMLKFRRPANPARVRFKTGSYRHGSAYWVEISRIADRMKMAEIDVRVASPTRIEVTKCENIERFELKLAGLKVGGAGPLTLTIGGQTITLSLRGSRTVALARAALKGAKWGLVGPPLPRVDAPKFPPAKRKGLEGPIHDAFRAPFLVVIGTTAKDEFERRVVREEAERWRRQWKRRFQTWPPVKDDHAVTAKDIAAKNLLLFGGPEANSITARVMVGLPVRIGGGKVVVGKREYKGKDLGLKLCYPNPLSPDRLVLIQAANTWRGMWQMTHRFGNWFDWMPLDNRDWFDFCVFDDKSAGFETMLDVGFFDEDWGLARANRWRGLKPWRAKVKPRVYPRFKKPPDADVVRLGDLWPRQIDTAKGSLAINRSFGGRPLSIGHRGQKHGLGQWIESAAVYDLGGKYRGFRTKFGIDAEGQKTISDARRSAERTTFQVWGDGRLLAEKRGVQFGDRPGSFGVDVSGVRGLVLRVLRQSPQGWLYGSITWGEPTLYKKPPATRR